MSMIMGGNKKSNGLWLIGTVLYFDNRLGEGYVKHTDTDELFHLEYSAIDEEDQYLNSNQKVKFQLNRENKVGKLRKLK